MRRLTMVMAAFLALTAAAGEPPLHMFVLDQERQARQVRAQAEASGPELHMTILPRADTAPESPKEQPTPHRFAFSLGLGYRRDDLDWAIEGNSGKTLSEEKWRSLDSIRLSGDAHIVTPIGLTFQGKVAYSWILAGRQRRSDFLGDRHNREFSRIVGDVDQGNGLDLSAGFGYRLPLWDGAFRAWLEPLAGYGYREQILKSADLSQAIATLSLTPPQGRLADSELRYRARWHGPWLGMQLGVGGERWQLYGQGEYHYAWYRAEGRWKQLAAADRRIRFKQDGDGYGVVAEVGGSYQIWDRLSLRLSLDFQHWKADSGNDKTTLEDGGKIHNRLKEAEWRSLGGNLSLHYDF